MNQQIKQTLSAGIRVCRVCQAEYIGHGALCPTHVAELAAQNAQANVDANAVLNAHIKAQLAERHARPRTEWSECV